MGIGVRTEEVDLAAKIVGCSTFSSPFTHLGVLVGSVMSRIKTWDDIISKIWRFLTQPSSLWVRFIKAIYGDKGAIDSFDSISRCSPWLDIIRESSSLTNKDKLKSESLDTSFRRAPRGGIEEEQQQLLQSHIEGIILAPMLDRWVWSYEASSEFSVKSVRNFIDDALLPEENVATRWLRRLAIRWCEFDFSECASYEEWLSWLNNNRLSKGVKEIFEGVNYVMWWLIWRFMNQAFFAESHTRKELLFDDLVRLSFI
ncbi:hypothetical protein Tco_0722851 [Tanacetum coccineum]